MHKSKGIYVLVSLLLLTVHISAQEGSDLNSLSKLRIGIKGGGSISALSSDASLSSNWGYGFQAGVTVSYTVFDWLKVSFEPVYANFSSGIKPSTLYYPNQDIIDRIQKSVVTLQCADLPLVLKLGIPGYGGKLKPVVSIGATSGIYFNAVSLNTWNYMVGNQLVVSNVNDNVTDRFRYYDIAGIIGAGFVLGNSSIELYYRLYLRSLNTVHYSTFNDYGLNSLQINFSYRF